VATNKHAIIRYHALDQCFSNPGRRYFIDDLISACNDALYEYTGVAEGVKRRQIFEDIKFMESEQGWSVPLERLKDGKQVYYRYSDKSFTRFKGMPQFEWMEEMHVRLESIFNFKSNTNVIVGFEQNQYLKGLNHFSELFHAIQYKKVLSIQYRGFKQTKPSQVNFHPYYLKQYNSRWFLFGYNEKYDNISNLALDRIINFKPINKKYQDNKTINFEEYFEDVVGVTVSNRASVDKVHLEIAPSLWPYIESKPIHGSQRVVSKKGGEVVIELTVQLNYELVTTLFAYGEGVKVLQPDSLKKEMITKAKALINKYL
jgi:hypothetical protein